MRCVAKYVCDCGIVGQDGETARMLCVCVTEPVWASELDIMERDQAS